MQEPHPGERTGWFVVVGAGVILPITLIAALFVISDIFVIQTTQAPAAAATRLTVRGDRPPVVVGGPLPGDEGRHRQRDPHPGADARAGRGADRRRHPQLLGAAAQPDDRHDPRPDQRDRALRRRRRPLPRTVPRVLRAAARPHVVLRLRRPAGGVPALARRPGAAGRRRRPAPPRSAASSTSCTAPARNCHTIRGTSASGVTGPT